MMNKDESVNLFDFISDMMIISELKPRVDQVLSLFISEPISKDRHEAILALLKDTVFNYLLEKSDVALLVDKMDRYHLKMVPAGEGRIEKVDEITEL